MDVFSFLSKGQQMLKRLSNILASVTIIIQTVSFQ